MKGKFSKGTWVKGLAEWIEGDTAFISVAFSWRLDDAYSRAVWYRAQGYKVRVGGPGTFTRQDYLKGIADVGGDYPDAVAKHNPMATFASRGCPVGGWVCIVPKMEGKDFTELPDFPVRPVLCDNNLSALSPEYQDYIVSRYQATGVPLLDANSGFEPKKFNEEVYRRWEPINKGAWRLAYDEQKEREEVRAAMHILYEVPQSRKRVYVLIGNEPMEACLERINEVIEWGGDPHAQPFIKLNAPEKKPSIRHDWSRQALADMARWCNGWVWRKAPFEDYRRAMRTKTPDKNQLSLPQRHHCYEEKKKGEGR